MKLLTKEQKLEMYGEHLDNFTIEPVKTIIEEIIINTPTSFFLASTSSSGKYHPLATNGVMGLIKHSVAVMLTAKDMMRNDTFMNLIGLINLSDLDKEVILAACLIHDNGKYGIEEFNMENDDYKFTTTQEHPRLVSEIAKLANLQNSLNDEGQKILIDILNLVETHMGQWVTVRGKDDLQKPSTPEQIFVHICDYIVSRKVLDVVSELSLPDNIDEKLVEWFEMHI